MDYSKQTVEEMFNGDGKLFPHQKDFLNAVKFLVNIKPDGFTHQHLHEVLDFFGRPETSRYNSFLTVLVNNNLLLKDENKVYTPSAIMKYICCS